MQIKTKDNEYWRIKGEQDRAQNRGYRKPHGVFSALFIWTAAGIRKTQQENNAYYFGWNYTTNNNK